MLRDGLHTRSMTFVPGSGHYADPNGLKTSIASATSLQTYSGTALNGTNVCGGGHSALSSWPTVTTSSTVGAFVAGSKVFFVGTYNRVTTERSATMGSADGNETLIADGPLDIGSVTQIRVEAQADTDGTLEFGWTGVAPRAESPKWRLVARTAAALTVEHEDGTQDTFTPAAGNEHLAWVRRILAATAATVTAYE